jgi:hypothetical protein
MPRVYIDGQEYIPVTTSPEARNIGMAIAALWWGESMSKSNFESRIKELHINVNDNGEGIPFEEALASIMRKLAKGAN